MVNEVVRHIKEIIGREPLTPPELARALHEAGWPARAQLAPEDFFFLSLLYPVKYDEEVPYFFVSATKVSPPAPTGCLDLSHRGVS